jgi:hypothetical protein
MTMGDVPVLKTVDEAIAYLVSELDEKDRKLLRKMKESDLITLHRGYGMGIRNELGLWNSTTELLKDPDMARFSNPDDMSMYLIERVWHRLQEMTDTNPGS